MRRISILGSTGSIGTQTLDVVRSRGDIRVEALAARSDIARMEEQIREFKPRFVGIYDEKKAEELAIKVADTGTRVIGGMEGVLEVATAQRAKLLVTGIVGMIGIEPTVAALCAGKDIALANKETLVCAGHLIMPLAAEQRHRILPVDSEHSAIFQCLRGNKKNPASRLILTASGGPFRGYSKAKLRTVTVEDALKHPNWTMGAKVTIDSSTMVNKGLEVMEAHWLFGVPMEKIEVVIQPQSIIHSAVEFADGAVIAQLGTADMRLPIQYALYYPKRLPVKGGTTLDFRNLKSIDIETPDLGKFPGLALAYRAGRTGGSLPTVFNAANELAVAAFLRKKLRYLEIPRVIEAAMEEHEKVGLIRNPSVEEIFGIQRDTIRWMKNKFKKLEIEN
ncbi:1-deoxy-D-xylulose-5-phosphate reductoisomerase [Lachnospiraceae bacterium]|nr:1-deoxy-D-xylulose-5-phosphate reductoisomerase [Lachnospiraceae bacterium]